MTPCTCPKCCASIPTDSPDIIGVDVRWTQAQIQTAEGMPETANAASAQLPGDDGSITLDPVLGARMIWVRTGQGLWRELRVGQWMKVSNRTIQVAGMLWDWTHHARLLWSRQPQAIAVVGREPWVGAVQVQTVDMLSQIASGIAAGKPSAAGASCTPSSKYHRWAVLDGRLGVGRAWVRVGGSNYDYFPVEHGMPFPIDGTAGFEVRVHPSEYGSKATFLYGANPLQLPPIIVSCYEATLAASTAALNNCLVFPISENVNALNLKLNFKATGAGAYSLDYHTDSGSGTAPVSASLAAGVTDASQQLLNTANAAVPILSIRLITFGGNARAWIPRA